MDIRESIRKEIEKMAALPEGTVSYSADFSEYPIDSLMIVQLVAMIEDDFDIIIPDDKLKEMTSVDAVAKLIEEIKNE
ncbi:MAG: hypothetical protein IJH37_08900 [Clostridia bacterium]|nr:hypothetical protein [Clostridia bacterium]